MVEILGLSNDSFGLEITDVSVRAMKLKRCGKNVRVVSVGVAAIPDGAMKAGDIKDEQKLVVAIKEAVGKAAGRKIKTKRVVVSLPENKAFLQVIKMPQLKNEDLRAAVIFEAENYIPLPLEKVYLDFEKVRDALPDNNSNCEVLIAAMPRIPVDALLQAITKSGLVPVAMELESGAIYRALSFDRDLESPAVMIHIGDAKTNILIYADNMLRFTFSIPISNRFFLEIISKNVGVDMARANELKRERGIEQLTEEDYGSEVKTDNDREKIMKIARQEEDYEKEKIFEALMPGLVDFVQQIKKCVTYYQTHYSGRSAAKESIEKIVICGSGSDLKGIDKFISMKMNTPVEKAKLKVDKDILGVSGQDSSICCEPGGFAVVFGLALRSLALEGNVKAELSKNKRTVRIPKPPVSQRRLAVKRD